MFIALSKYNGTKPADVAKLIIDGARNVGPYTAANKDALMSCWRTCSNFLSKVKSSSEDYSLVILNLGSTPAHAIVVTKMGNAVADSMGSYKVSGSVDSGTISYRAPITKNGKKFKGEPLPYTVAYKISLAEALRKVDEDTA